MDGQGVSSRLHQTTEMAQDEFLPAQDISKCFAVEEILSVRNTFSGLPGVFKAESTILWFTLRLIPHAIFPGQDSSCLKATFAESDMMLSSFLFFTGSWNWRLSEI